MSCLLCIGILWWGYNFLKKRQADMEEFTTNLSNTNCNTNFFMKDRTFLAQWVGMRIRLHICTDVLKMIINVSFAVAIELVCLKNFLSFCLEFSVVYQLCLRFSFTMLSKIVPLEYLDLQK